MSIPNRPHGTPVDIDQHNEAAPPVAGASASGKGIASLVLSAAAVFISPLLLLIPYVGFLPALIAGAGVVIAWAGLRGSTRGTGLAVTALIISVVLCALLAGIATVWNVVIAGPAIRDYGQLHQVINDSKSLIFGS